MNPTHARGPAQERSALDRDFARRNNPEKVARALTLAKAQASIIKPPPWDETLPFYDYEIRTHWFRRDLATKHLDHAKDARDAYRAALETWDPLDEGSTSHVVELGRGATSRASWHAHRAGGQTKRFDRVRTCGSRVIIAHCDKDRGGCGAERKPIPEGCGVRRVCEKCDTQNAVKRRARFGRARGRVFVDGARYGLRRKLRKGGRYDEKMLTLTVPHVTREECTGIVREEARSDLHARVVALFRAWPRFWRKVWRHLKDRWEFFAKMHRAFEWTPASDGIGHPHFHVYLFCPFIDRDLLRAWWGEALAQVGVPVKRCADGKAQVMIDLRVLKSFDVNAARELMKGGRRQALTLSRIDYAEGPGLDAYAYAEGWTLGDIEEFCGPDTRAGLYMALEGKRLSQASRGFFEADAPPHCECCYESVFRVRFEPKPNHETDASCTHERGPP